jgi:hypothetical protein
MRNSILLSFLVLSLTDLSEAHVAITYPQAGAQFEVGQTVNIEWAVVIPHTTIAWDVYFSADNGLTWIPIEVGIDTSETNYVWTVPASLTSEGQLRVVQNNLDADYEDVIGGIAISMATGISESIDVSDVSVYPNPCSDHVNFTFESVTFGQIDLAIFDPSGRQVLFLEDFSPQKITLYDKAIIDGQYMYRLYYRNRPVRYGKFVVKH